MNWSDASAASPPSSSRLPKVFGKGGDNRTGRDDIVMLEVRVSQVDKPWWASYRKHLQELLGQELIVIRALSMESL